jgi:DNA helicase-2/ATP-dependent DNA helicase PcrA
MQLILGGPGCGKTTKLLSIIDGHISKGVKPNRIGYLTFTKKGAEEGLERTLKKFGFDKKEVPYFRTIHSLAFQQLGLSTTEIMTDSDYQEFGRLIGMDLTSGPLMEDGQIIIPQKDQGKAYLALVTMARLTQRPLRAICQDAFFNFDEVDWFNRSLDFFKKDKGLVDFTDMLEIFCERGLSPKLDVLIVDEAQDLSALQWRCIEQMAGGVDHVYIAGDDDQAIYQWAGADIEHFLGLQGSRHVLPKSFRLKRNIFNVTQAVVRNISHRFSKDWQPHSDGGIVERVDMIEHVNFDEGTWLLLARNRYMLNSMAKHLHHKGYPYIHNGQSSVDNDTVKSILLWEALRAGKTLNGRETKLLVKHLNGKVNPTIDKLPDSANVDLQVLVGNLVEMQVDNWMGAVRMSDKEREYYREVKSKGESLVDTPRLNISTIHGVKGGEADHVLLGSDMSGSSHKNFLSDPSSESRVFYVGASRAKESLHIVRPRTMKFYPIGEQI